MIQVAGDNQVFLMFDPNEQRGREVQQHFQASGYNFTLLSSTHDVQEQFLRQVPRLFAFAADIELTVVEQFDPSGGQITTPSATLVYGETPDALSEWLLVGIKDYLVPPWSALLTKATIEAALERHSLGQNHADIAKQAELRLIERDVQIGRDIQQSFLPETLPQPIGWDLSAYFQPAREVAGDFYDGFELLNKRRVGIVMADVCDKGVPAAIFMALFRTLIRYGAQQNVSLSWTGSPTGGDDSLALAGRGDRRQKLPRIGTSALLNAVGGTNAYMTDNHIQTGYFVTLFFGIFDPTNGSLIYINGGHNPPVLMRNDGSHVLLKATGPAVGMLPGASYKIAEVVIEPGETLFTYTDGVPEAKNPQGQFFGNERMLALLKSNKVKDSSQLLLSVKDALTGFMQDAVQFDDITMLAVHRHEDTPSLLGSDN
jgi:phosphoserine phosphatase RsbU/P